MGSLNPEVIINYSIIGWIIYHLLTKTIPEYNKLRVSIIDLQKMLLYHDLTSRKQDPTMTGSNKELEKLMTEEDKANDK